MKKEKYLKLNEHIIRDKIVLDLACHEGESTSIIQKLGSKYIYGVDARRELIDVAKRNLKKNVEFFTGDIQDENLITPLIEKSNTVVVLGVLYHLYNHFGFFSSILKPNIEHVIIETIAGPDTLNPEMFWGFESVNNNLNGWHDSATIIPNGSPNLSWILQSAKIFDFECDWVCHYGYLRPKRKNNVTIAEYMSIKDETWPDYEEFISSNTLPEHILNDIYSMLDDRDDNDSGENKRVLLRLYNKKLINSAPINLKDCYSWDPK